MDSCYSGHDFGTVNCIYSKIKFLSINILVNIYLIWGVFEEEFTILYCTISSPSVSFLILRN